MKKKNSLLLCLFLCDNFSCLKIFFEKQIEGQIPKVSIFCPYCGSSFGLSVMLSFMDAWQLISIHFNASAVRV